MHFLTVTCNRDRWLFELQTASLKFLNNCTIHVVINEEDTASWLLWYQTIKPNNHTVKIYTKSDFTNLSDGWLSQQLIKLYFSKYAECPYIVLDSKNFFTRPIAEIKQNFRTSFNNFKTTQNVLGFNTYVPPCTPYVIDPNITKQFVDDEFEDWFFNLPEPSEFLVYDYYVQKNNLNQEYAGPISKTLWYHENYNYEDWCNLDYPILGIHPLFIKMNPKIDWNKWLTQKGLNLPSSPVPKLSPLDWSVLCG